MSVQDFDGRVAVITGGASGIGLATARVLAGRGMKLVIADIEGAALDAACESLRAGGADVVGVRTDVSVEAEVDALADAAYRHHGAVHVLFNNAGVAATAATLRRRAWEGPLSDWDWTMAVNFNGVLYGVRAFLPRMIDGGEEGHVVNTASMAGMLTGANPYNVSKHGVVCLTEGLYKDLLDIGSKLSASVVCPGLINTRILEAERNRDRGEPTDVGVLRADLQEFAAGFENALRNGYGPEVVAECVAEGIEANRFYLFPAQPFIIEQMHDRMQGIIDGRNPNPR